jgi:putative membrane protein
MNLRACILVTATAVAIAPYAVSQPSSFSDEDKTFLKNATEDNLAEIKMGELALKASKNPTVTGFAQKMVTDHRALIAGAKPVAMKAGVTPPTSPSMTSDAEYMKLKLLSGDAFDKSYVKTMVSDHHDDLDKVNSEHDSTQNPAMKKLTAHAAQVISGHKEMIDGIAGKMGVQ